MLVTASNEPSGTEGHGMPICIGVCDPYIAALTVLVARENSSAVDLWVVANHPLRPSAGTALMTAVRHSITDVQKQHAVAPRWWIPPP